MSSVFLDSIIIRLFDFPVRVQDEVTLEVLDGDETLVHLQLSLAAYTQIVMRSLCDTVPKLVYNQLVTKVCVTANALPQGLWCN